MIIVDGFAHIKNVRIIIILIKRRGFPDPFCVPVVEMVIVVVVVVVVVVVAVCCCRRRCDKKISEYTYLQSREKYAPLFEHISCCSPTPVLKRRTPVSMLGSRPRRTKTRKKGRRPGSM